MSVVHPIMDHVRFAHRIQHVVSTADFTAFAPPARPYQMRSLPLGVVITSMIDLKIELKRDDGEMNLISLEMHGIGEYCTYINFM
jgi:hypothetical protein